MRLMRATGAALLAALAIIPLGAAPAAAETYGYTGLVTDSDGSPVANACFALHTSPTEVAAEYCSGADGRYLIPGEWDAPEYKIRIHAAGFRTQWWYDAPDHLNGSAVSIPAGTVVERNFTLGRGAGGITGKIFDENTSATEATVVVEGVDTDYRATAYTDGLGTGRYALNNLPPGRYRILVYDNVHTDQWVPRKETREEAGIYTVTDGGTLTVDEYFLPMGVVEARVIDAVTRLPVRRPCLSVNGTGGNDTQACGVNGLVRVPNIRPGDWTLSIGGGASYFPIDETEYVHVERGQTTTVSYALNPAAAITTSVRDAASGAPLDGICVLLVRPRFGGISAHMGSTCSDTDGSLEIGPFQTLDTVQLYAYQSTNPYDPQPIRYGDQWVTADGGSGDQGQALKVSAPAGRTVTVPPIRMDPPGSISGTIRNAAGAAAPGVCAYPFAFHPGQGGTYGKHCSDSTGRYTISALGPYRWPVEFTPNTNTGYAWQWSGDVADRSAASTVAVTRGGTATMDAKLVSGGSLAGRVTDGATPVDAGYVWTYSARTGDVASPSFTNIARDGTFTLRGHRTQQVYVEYWSLTAGCWYGYRGKPASTVPVTAGQTTTIAADMSRTCGRVPVGASSTRTGSAATAALSPIAAPTSAGNGTWRTPPADARR